MHFVSLNDLVDDINDWLPSLADRYDCVVGVPRSGMLAASVIALKLGLPLGDLDGFLQGDLLGAGHRYSHHNAKSFLENPKRVLIVDDSISSGKALKEVKGKLLNNITGHHVTLAAVYVTAKGAKMCDCYARMIPNPRRFEWNVLSSRAVENYCFDMDGVLCLDPLPRENDDGPLYRSFIENAKPLFIPHDEIGAIVTSRLEKYRSETETWLRANGVKYKKLYMLDLPSKEDRITQGAAPIFKAEQYRNSGLDLFIESDHNQAVSIAEHSGKFVYAVDSRTMHGPGFVTSLFERKRMGMRQKLRQKAGRALRLMKHVGAKLGVFTSK